MYYKAELLIFKLKSQLRIAWRSCRRIQSSHGTGRRRNRRERPNRSLPERFWVVEYAEWSIRFLLFLRWTEDKWNISSYFVANSESSERKSWLWRRLWVETCAVWRMPKNWGDIKSQRFGFDRNFQPKNAMTTRYTTRGNVAYPRFWIKGKYCDFFTITVDK